MSGDKRNRTDDIFDRIRNHRWLSLLIVAGTVIIGLGALTNAIESIREFVVDSSETTRPSARAGHEVPEAEGLGSDEIAKIARDLTSNDPLTRRAGVLVLADHPDQAVPLLVTSSVLGAMEQDGAREDTAFISMVQRTLVAAGPSAVTPLVNEWRRTLVELRSRFAHHPRKTRTKLLGFIRHDLNGEFPISASSLVQGAINSGELTSDDKEALEQLAEPDTLELVSARRNIIRTIAEALRVNRVEGLDLSGLALGGDFRRVNLRGADLSRCHMVGANFSGSDLAGANLREADLNGTNLSQANLSNANMMEISTADGANFSHATLDGSDFSHSRILHANFQNSSLRQVDFSESVLNRSDLSGADLSGARLTQALMISTDLAGLRGFEDIADLSITNLRGARGLSEIQREVAASRGAVWDDTVATAVDDFPEGLAFSPALRDHIRYDAAKSVLIWSGGEMSRDDYNEMRTLLNSHVDSSNGILRLSSRSWYARER